MISPISSTQVAQPELSAKVAAPQQPAPTYSAAPGDTVTVSAAAHKAAASAGDVDHDGDSR